MTTSQNYGTDLIGGALAIGIVGLALGAAENLIRNKGKLRLGRRPIKRRRIRRRR